MEIRVVKREEGWKNALKAARATANKADIDKEPSDKFKHNIIYAEHSPLRELIFDVDFIDVPYYVIMHLVRHHEGCNWFVGTSRADRTGVPREERRQTDLIHASLTINAQAFINISKVRLCACADATTRQTWKLVIEKLGEIEPLLAHACVPTCVYRGFCPELTSCGYVNTPAYAKARAAYVKE